MNKDTTEKKCCSECRYGSSVGTFYCGDEECICHSPTPRTEKSWPVCPECQFEINPRLPIHQRACSKYEELSIDQVLSKPPSDSEITEEKMQELLDCPCHCHKGAPGDDCVCTMLVCKHCVPEPTDSEDDAIEEAVKQITDFDNPDKWEPVFVRSVLRSYGDMRYGEGMKATDAYTVYLFGHKDGKEEGRKATLDELERRIAEIYPTFSFGHLTEPYEGILALIADMRKEI